MKTLLIILVTAGFTFASAYFVVTSQQSARSKDQLATAQAEWQRQKAELESALATAQTKPGQTTVIAAASRSGPVRLTPREILDKLIAIKPGTGADRARNIRLVVFYLESLTEWEQEALPVIHDFLAQNQDVDYTTPDNNEDNPEQNQTNNRQRNRDNIWQFRRGGELRTDFVLPPSLRLGLVDVVRAIGGLEAEKILASTLETTGRGIEVAYLARVLEEVSPGKYRTLALTVAKDLLTNPPVIDSPNRLDELAKGYLYGVLILFNDTSFASTAQAMLVGADGRIDRNALNYLNSLLKEQAVPALYQAYLNTSLTNQGDKAQLARSVLNYVGQNSTANQMFNEIVTNTNIDGRMRAMAIMQLAGGGFGPMSSESPADPKMIQARINLLNGLLAQTADEWTARVAGNTITNLNHLLNGEPMENFRPGGGPGGQGGSRRGGQRGQAQGTGNN